MDTDILTRMKEVAALESEALRLNRRVENPKPAASASDRVLAGMKPGREYTTCDIETIFRLHPSTARTALSDLKRRGLVDYERLCFDGHKFGIWRRL